MSYTLINFNMPNYLKTNFDNLVKFKQISRTSILNTMIEEYCRREFKLIKDDGLLNSLIKDINERNPSNSEHHLSRRESSYDEPINIPTNNDYFDPFYDGIRL